MDTAPSGTASVSGRLFVGSPFNGQVPGSSTATGEMVKLLEATLAGVAVVSSSLDAITDEGMESAVAGVATVTATLLAFGPRGTITVAEVTVGSLSVAEALCSSVSVAESLVATGSVASVLAGSVTVSETVVGTVTNTES